MKYTNRIKAPLLITTFSLILAACGGGGGDSGTPPPTPTPTPTPVPANVAPVIDAMADQELNERESFSYTATATDSDGTINNMSWIQKSGIEFGYSNENNTISFIAPALTETQTLVFTFLATDEDGAESQADLTITIHALKNIEDVVIPDAALKGCIDEVVQDSDARHADVGLFDADSELRCVQKGVSDLTGLEEFADLTILGLRMNDISDLTPLSGLKNIEVLELSDNKLTSLNGISQLTKLTDLTLNNNLLTSLDGLPAAPDITALSVSSNKLVSLNGIQVLSNLTQIDANTNQLNDISALASLTQLTSVILYDNNLSVLTGLENHNQLTTLYLGGNPLSDISALPDADNLTSLALTFQNKDTFNYDMPLSDISPLQKLNGLERLVIWGDNVSDISVLAPLSNLKELELITYTVSDISVFANFTQLEKLRFHGYTTPYGGFPMNVADLSALSSLGVLKELYVGVVLGDNDCSPISLLISLERVHISNPLTCVDATFANLTNLVSLQGVKGDDIDQIKNLSKLHTLWATWPDELSTLDFLTNFPLLEDIHVGGGLNSTLSDFSALDGYKQQLTRLSIGGTLLSDVTFLSDFNSLKILHLLVNKSLFDLTPLHQLTQLDEILFYQNDHIACEQFDSLEAALPFTKVYNLTSCSSN